MSVGLGKMERRVLKMLREHRKWRQANPSFYTREGRPDVLSVTDLAWDFLYGGCQDYPDEAAPPSRAVYQSVCRAVRNLERKGLVKSGKIITFWEDGWWAKTVTLAEDRSQHLNTEEIGVGVNT